MEDGHWLVSAGLVTSSIIAITANAFLLLIFCRRRGLRTVPNRFVINLLIANLLSSVLLVPLLLVDQGAPRAANASHDAASVVVLNATAVEGPPPALCRAAQAAASFVSTLSILSILLIGVNQYFGVIHSLRYHAYINKCRSTALIAAAWLAALALCALAAATDSDGALWRLCHPPRRSAAAAALNAAYAVTYCLLVILAPFMAICVIYVRIYAAAHDNSERMRKSTSANLDGLYRTCDERSALPKVRSAPDFARLDAGVKVARTVSERAANSLITSIKHKISNASVFRYREETRAAKVSALVVFLVLFCYVPYGAALVLNSGAVGVETPPTFNTTALLLLALSNGVSPFLFGYRNRRVKREISKVLGLAPPKRPDLAVLGRRRSANDERTRPNEPFLGYAVPEVIVTCKVESERRSILKRVYDSSNWASYKKCNFIAVPESCIGGETRGSFSSASTQISNEDC